MRTPELVRWDFVQQWLGKAHRDLLAASVLLEADLEDYENAGFHAQQAAEKYIKAFLVRHQIEFPKTHDIAILRRLPLSETSCSPHSTLDYQPAMTRPGMF